MDAILEKPSDPNLILGTGSKGWIAQFGAFGAVVLLLLVGGYRFVSMADRMQSEVIDQVKEMQRGDREERQADRSRTEKLADVIERNTHATERVADKLNGLASVVERLERKVNQP
jgi:hypothetical protein